MSQSKKSSSSPSKRTAQLLRELQDQRLQSQRARRRLIENWSRSVPEPERETFPGTIMGFRYWGIELGGRLAPIGMTQMPPWSPRWNAASCCKAGWIQDIRLHGDSPSYDCTCGFWALYKENHAKFASSPICGVVEGAGRVVLHEEGFRAQHARVKAIFLAPLEEYVGNVTGSWKPSTVSMLPEIAELYRVPLLRNADEAREMFPISDPKDFGINPEPWRVQVLNLGAGFHRPLPIKLTNEQVAEFLKAIKFTSDGMTDG